MNMRASFVLSVVLLSSSCSMLNVRTSDDREITLIALREICDNEKPGLFVLSVTTAVVDRNFVIDDFDETTRQSLIQRNRTSIQLPATSTCRKLRLLAAGEMDSYFKAADKGGLQERWSAFHQEHPDINGIMTLSLPGYSKRGDEAILQVTGTCGPLCGNGSFWIFSKVSGRWRLEKTVQGWSS